MIYKTIECISLYLCKSCNLECQWCYDQANSFVSIDFELFEEFYNTVIKDNIRNIVLIGGEPFVHPQIQDIIGALGDEYLYIASNGLPLMDDRKLSIIKKRKNISLSIAIKGFDADTFLNTTRRNAFDEFEQVLDELNSLNAHTNFSYIYTGKTSKEDSATFLAFCERHHINAITISEPRPFLDDKGKVVSTLGNHDSFQDFILCLMDCGINVCAKIQSPFCEYSTDFIDYLLEKNAIVSSCSVKTGGALFFNSKLELVLCHSNYDIKLGRYGEDFENYDELKDFFYSKEICKVYNRFRGCPQKQCLDCKYWKVCGGGCIMNWRMP
ncbi:radical SAM protein [Ruminococcus sp.]|uniref:radical SAM protein n=1 Tax=Ruminococcus sp. TaxID=41978 RepID=UPI0025DC13ED|nr:radical SAM protein [Ruminococcus sp.]